MLYSFRKFLCGTALSLVMSSAGASSSYAQAVVSLGNEELPAISNETSTIPLTEDKVVTETVATATTTTTEPAPMAAGNVSLSDEIPNEISLFDEESSSMNGFESGSGLIAPQASPAKPAAVGSVSGSSSSSTYTPQNIAPQGGLGDDILNAIDSELFSKMSALEKQTTLLNLELRRERVKTEIEAIKAQRRKAEQEEREAEEEKKRKQIEWEKEQERKIIEEQRKLKETEIALEQLRQEKVLKAYKETMLEENLKWIATNEIFYKNLAAVEKERDEIVNNFKAKLQELNTAAEKNRTEALAAKEAFDKEMAAFTSQIAVLKARLEASEAALAADKSNPFAVGVGGSDADKDVKLTDEYAVMEIRGQGDELIAKLMNKEGKYFTIKEGSVLQTGHIVDEISQTYIRADKGGSKDYIYFSAGGVLEREPTPNEVEALVKLSAGADNKASAAAATAKPTGSRRARSIGSSVGVPSLNTGMNVKE